MLGTPDTAAAAPGGHIIDGTDQTFMQDVIEASQTTPVIVDFWATWCGPCKTLGPAIEAAVTAAKGAVKLVKIDVDKNPGYRWPVAGAVDPDGLCVLAGSTGGRVSGGGCRRRRSRSS